MISFFDPAKKLFLGELSLDGVVRPIKGVLLLVREAKRRGFTEVFVPKENAEEAALIEGIAVFGVDTLLALVNHLNERQKEIRMRRAYCLLQNRRHLWKRLRTIPSLISPMYADRKQRNGCWKSLLEADIMFVCTARRELENNARASVFSHSASSFFEEALEVTGIHSVAGSLRGAMISTPPFRAPHHTSSYTSLVRRRHIPRARATSRSRTAACFF